MPPKSPRKRNNTPVGLGRDPSSASQAKTKSVASPIYWKYLVLIASAMIAAAWLYAVMTLSARNHLLLNYETLVFATPFVEPWAAPLSAIVVGMTVIGIWLAAFNGCFFNSPRAAISSAIWIGVSAGLTLTATLARAAGGALEGLPVTTLEPLWLSGFSGLAALKTYQMISLKISAWPGVKLPTFWVDRLPPILLLIASFGCGIWWTWQSIDYYNRFLLGFNDFGHFAQRIANTASGRGFLIETPVLPPFWDHFNPGLLLLVPIWYLFPNVHWIFGLQAFCLASGGPLVYVVARQANHTKLISGIWGAAYLLHPVLGQMNLAYTYGWHPVTLALPLLLVSVIAVGYGKNIIAAAVAVLAASMEENVLVAIAMLSAVRALHIWMGSNYFHVGTKLPLDGRLGVKAWGAIFAISTVAFILVFRFSGMAEFQTGRFVSLGTNIQEVLLSPILKPAIFWGHLFRYSNLIFILGLTLPFFWPALYRGKWILPAITLPVAVLLIWDHAPAKCLAFQYPTTLMPTLWLTAIYGCQGNRSDRADTCGFSKQGFAWGAAVTGLVASIFFGQFPWSSPTLVDVVVSTYQPSDQVVQRRDSLGWQKVLASRLQDIAAEGEPVLATGRVASHLVGVPDLETVGQFLQREAKLEQMLPHGMGAIQRYRWIVLDQLESFQQTPEESKEVEAKARDLGFESDLKSQHLVRYGIVVLVQSKQGESELSE